MGLVFQARLSGGMWAHCGSGVKLPGFYGFHAFARLVRRWRSCAFRRFDLAMNQVFQGGRMRWILLMTSLVLAGATQARADGIQTGEQLLANCQSNKPSCSDYVSGAVDAIYSTQSVTFVCTFIPPDGFSEEKAAGVVFDYLKSHPEELKMSGAYNVRAALMEAYPCPN
jgi:Rap1a immunity proteins